MKKIITILALMSSASAMAASDLYVNQALQKSVGSQQLLKTLEDSIPAILRPLVQGNIDALKFQLVAVQMDLSMSLDPNAQGNQQINKGFVCSTKDTFHGKIYTGRGQTKMEAQNSAQTACINAEDAFWCKGAISCEQVM